MKIRSEGRVPPGKERTLTKGNRELAVKARPDTGGEETRHVHSDGQSAGATSQTSGSEEEGKLLASLRELVSREGPVKAAEALGVTYRTVTRAIETNTLTRRTEDALKLRELEAGGAMAEPVSRRLDTFERRQEELEAGLLALAHEVRARLAKISGDSEEVRDALPARDVQGQPGRSGERTGEQVEAGHEAAVERMPAATPAATGVPQAVIGRPRRVDRLPFGHPEVVTVEPVPEEEFDYAEAAPLVVEWRQARAAFLSKGASRVESARGGVRMCELELVLIGDHELTLPPSTYRWDETRRRDELLRARVSLIGARWELAHALFWRWVRLIFTHRALWR